MFVDLTGDASKYGAIARHMVDSGDVINLNIHGQPSEQNPPLVFWLAALGVITSYSIHYTKLYDVNAFFFFRFFDDHFCKRFQLLFRHIVNSVLLVLSQCHFFGEFVGFFRCYLDLAFFSNSIFNQLPFQISYNFV